MNLFYREISLRNWAWFFQPSFIDPDSICSKVFVVCGGLVFYSERRTAQAAVILQPSKRTAAPPSDGDIDAAVRR